MPKPEWVALHQMSIERIELGIECGNHPELLTILTNNFANEPFEVRLAAVAAYCEVVVDGYYMPEELDKLCDKLTQRLRQKRSIIILPTHERLQ